MDRAHLRLLQCPKCKKKFPDQALEPDGAIVCRRGHAWKVRAGIPSLVHPPTSPEDARWIADYDKMADTYDESVQMYSEMLGVDMKKERQGMTAYIPIEGPVKILDVSIGTAANFEAIAGQYSKEMGRFNLHGLDLSEGMLRVSRAKAERLGLELSLTHGSVFNLPYKQGAFDIVLHSGGVNTFSDIPKALSEIYRVLAKGGLAIVVDEGLSPQKRKTEEGKAIIANNSLFAFKPPLEHLPEGARDLEVTYVMNDTFYQIVFSK
jgi:ubiquinone/menaquinone biosynthesis C-methylase UbiE